MRDFTALKVWEKAHVLTLEAYKATAGFPVEERYGLTDQIRRAARSIPTNIAEGCGRNSIADLARFVDMAVGSASELEYHFLLARDLRLLQRDRYERLRDDLVEVKRMAAGFLRRLRADNRKALIADS